MCSILLQWQDGRNCKPHLRSWIANHLEFTTLCAFIEFIYHQGHGQHGKNLTSRRIIFGPVRPSTIYTAIGMIRWQSWVQRFALRINSEAITFLFVDLLKMCFLRNFGIGGHGPCVSKLNQSTSGRNILYLQGLSNWICKGKKSPTASVWKVKHAWKAKEAEYLPKKNLIIKHDQCNQSKHLFRSTTKKHQEKTRRPEKSPPKSSELLATQKQIAHKSPWTRNCKRFDFCSAPCRRPSTLVLCQSMNGAGVANRRFGRERTFCSCPMTCPKSQWKQ